MPLSWNLGTLTSWNPLGHSRPVMGLLYLYLYLLSICVLATKNYSVLRSVTDRALRWWQWCDKQAGAGTVPHSCVKKPVPNWGMTVGRNTWDRDKCCTETRIQKAWLILKYSVKKFWMFSEDVQTCPQQNHHRIQKWDLFICINFHCRLNIIVIKLPNVKSHKVDLPCIRGPF